MIFFPRLFGWRLIFCFSHFSGYPAVIVYLAWLISHALTILFSNLTMPIVCPGALSLFERDSILSYSDSSPSLHYVKAAFSQLFPKLLLLIRTSEEEGFTFSRIAWYYLLLHHPSSKCAPTLWCWGTRT